MLRISDAPEHPVAEWLRHANISTTSRYLKASRADLQKQLKAFKAHRARKSKAVTKKRAHSHEIRTNALGASETIDRSIAAKSLN